jgi:hypothetical protein
MPPTVVCLEDLARAGSAAEFFAQEPVIRLIRPVLARNDAGGDGHPRATAALMVAPEPGMPGGPVPLLASHRCPPPGPPAG